MASKEYLLGLESNWRTLAAIAATAGASALALVGCGNGTKKAETVTVTVGGAQSTETSTTSEELSTLTFDDLGARYNTIFVYPGVSQSGQDKLQNGEYKDGETVPAVCKTEGRTIKSVPPEIHRQSNEWIRIHGTPGETQYATAVYVEHPQELLHQLKDC